MHLRSPQGRGLPPAHCVPWVDVVDLGSLEEEPAMAPTLADVGFPIRYKEGYTDLTAYQTLKSAQRAEYSYRPLVYICSPYSGDIENNVELA